MKREDEGRAGIGAQARGIGGGALADALVASQRRTAGLLDDLDAQASAVAHGWDVPRWPTINPPLWEYGHLAWFAEWWTLRDPRPASSDPRGPWQPARPSRLAHADRWFDSGRVAHDTRWSLDLPPRGALDDYVATVLDAACTRLAREVGDRDDDEALYPYRLALFHHDMHNEALTGLRQAIDYREPTSAARFAHVDENLQMRPDAMAVEPTGGRFTMGMTAARGFAFDNERPLHTVELAPFAIDARCVSYRAFAAFVDDGGYARGDCWSADGRRWLASTGATAPARWRRDADGWSERWFGRRRPLPSDAPVCHVNAFEAEAYAAWAGRRLPSEAEWECAATSVDRAEPGPDDFAWGRVWEWTATAFRPYAGFEADRYRDYSAPWFDTHRAVRGASFATAARLVHPRYRNFYTPERHDLFVGFRTCRA